MLRSMVSLEPLTVQNRRYPLLFQTGETAYGQPIVDGQHPHDLVMELGIQYARPLNSRAMMTFYYAPVGDAALGVVAFPHRASAMEIPQAALGHHWMDSTHIANNLATVGLNFGKMRFDSFHRGIFLQQRIITWIIGDHRNIRGVSFVTGPRMSNVV